MNEAEVREVKIYVCRWNKNNNANTTISAYSYNNNKKTKINNDNDIYMKVSNNNIYV